MNKDSVNVSKEHSGGVAIESLNSRVTGLTGRELDTAVAERVMNYIHVPSLGDWAWRRRGSDDLPHSVPHYSTSIAVAMQVLDKLQEQGFGWSLISTNDGWDACCFPPPDSENREGTRQTAHSLPEAICRAALAAVAHNEPERDAEITTVK